MLSQRSLRLSSYCVCVCFPFFFLYSVLWQWLPHSFFQVTYLFFCFMMTGVVLPSCKLFGLMQPSPRMWGFYGKVNGDFQEDLYQQHFLDCCCQYSFSKTLLTHTSKGHPPACRSGSVFCGVTDTLPSVLVCIQDFVYVLHTWFCLCPPWVETLFPQVETEEIVFRIPVTKSCWSSKSDYLRIPSPFTGSPGWEAWYGPQNLNNSWRASLVLLFSNLWITHPSGMGFDFTVIVSLLPSCCSFFFVYKHKISCVCVCVCVCSSILPLMVV